MLLIDNYMYVDLFVALLSTQEKAEVQGVPTSIPQRPQVIKKKRKDIENSLDIELADDPYRKGGAVEQDDPDDPYSKR